MKSQENQERRKNRKVLLLLLMLVMTGTLLVTSTYAWFTANETVKVDTITVDVTTSGGIQLSADGTNWKSVVLTTDLTTVHGTTYPNSVNQIPGYLSPVSTGLNIDTSGKMEMYHGVAATNTSGDFILTTSKNTEVEGDTGNFIAFDLFFKSDTDTDLYLTPDAGVETGTVADKGIKNSSRIAFVVLGHTSADSSVATIQGLNTGVSSPKYLWEPNYDTHSSYGIAAARDTYGITIPTTGTNSDSEAITVDGEGVTTNNDIIAYDGVIAEIDAAANVLLGNAKETSFDSLFKSVVPVYKTKVGQTTATQIFSLTAGVTKVRVYMWVEGQDVDCENKASGGTINYNLDFTITP